MKPWEKYASSDGPWSAYAPPAPKERGIAEQARDVLAGAVRGAGSIGATLLWPVDKATDLIMGDRGPNITGVVTGQQPLSRNEQRRQDMTDALGSVGLGADTDSTAFAVGKVAGEIAGTAGAGGALANVGARSAMLASKAAPLLDAVRTGGMSAGGLTGAAGLGVRAAGGAATGATSAAMVNPEDAAQGGVIGAALPGVAKAAGAVGGAVGRALSPNVRMPELARVAVEKYGIPLGPADISASRTTKAARSILNDAPLTAGIGERQRENVVRAFNRAIGDTFDAAAEKLTPAVMKAAKVKLGAEFDRIWSGNSLVLDGDFVKGIRSLQASADELPAGESARLGRWIDDLLSRAAPDASGALSIPGEVANKFQSTLRREADKAQGFLKEDLSNLRREILGAFNRNVSPADAAALAANQAKYRAMKTVEPVVKKAEAGVGGREVGDVAPELLPMAVIKSYGDNMASSPFADLVQIGSHFIADRVARTGGSTRAAIQNTALGGALVGGAMGGDLLTAGATIPAAMLTQKAMGSPLLGRASLAMNKGAGGPALTLAEQLKQLAFRGLPVAGAPLTLSGDP